VDAVASGLCANVDDGIAEAFGFGEEDVFFAGDPQGKARLTRGFWEVAGFKGYFAADGGKRRSSCRSWRCRGLRRRGCGDWRRGSQSPRLR